MSDSPEQVWSDAPNTPQIPSSLYTAEKAAFTGVLIGAISHGTLTHVPARPCLPSVVDPFFRDHGGPVLPMHECVALARQSHQEGH